MGVILGIAPWNAPIILGVRAIAKRAAEHPKPVLLELCGKAPLIVLEDADLDEAVKAARFRRLKEYFRETEALGMRGITQVTG